MKTTQMIDSYPAEISVDRELLAAAIDAVTSCSQACTACADACLREDMVAELRRCIRTDLDCADICATTGRILSRHTEFDTAVARAQLTACIQACKSCGDECERHSTHHEHCRVCADACHACEQACAELLASLN